MSTLAFLSPGGASETAIARSPMERSARAAGASFDVREGWNVALHYGSAEREAATARATVGWADVSHIAKLELQGDVPAEGAHVLRLTPTRALVLEDIDPFRDHPGAVEVTSAYGALVLAGPLAHEVIARFCALDLRDAVAPVGAVRPGSIARQPGILVREADERFLLLFGAASGQYMWTVVQDAARHLGGTPIGIQALAMLRREEVRAGA